MTWPLGFLRRLFRRPPDPAAAAEAFRRDRSALLDAFLAAGRATGRPRGLRWLSAEGNGEPLFVTERGTGRLVGLLPVVVAFEPEPGSELEDVPQAREPRPVVAVFAFEGGRWRTTGRAVFNLSAEQVVERSGGRFSPLSPLRERGLW